MCSRIEISPSNLQNEVLDEFLKSIRDSHDSGGAYLNAFEIPADPVFDWFASRDRLSEDGLLDSLLLSPAIREAMPDICGKTPGKTETGLKFHDPFMLDGTLARILYNGGAYFENEGDGRAEKAFATSVCEAMFESRFAEVSCYLTCEPWSRWFLDVGWDRTIVAFDRRTRKLWILVTTETD
jgi:hypothetical protein